MTKNDILFGLLKEKNEDLLCGVIIAVEQNRKIGFIENNF
jgi:hypothetical protein